jgi:hypothetical protein
MIYIYFLFLVFVDSSYCIYESSTSAVDLQHFNISVASVGCINGDPLVSFETTPLLESIFNSCLIGSISVCSSGLKIGNSMKELLNLRLIRTLQQARFNSSNDGWWTNSQLNGDFIQGGFTLESDVRLFGLHVQTTSGQKKWLCIRSN